MGVRGLLVYCSDFKCSHWGKIDPDRWPDAVRLSELEPLFACRACGIKGANSSRISSGTRRRRRGPPPPLGENGSRACIREKAAGRYTVGFFLRLPA